MSVALLITAVFIVVTIGAAIRNARLIIAAHPKNFGKYMAAHKTEDILLVTAHPDDECMFFSPTVVSAKRTAAKMHLLCLTSGNADGLGKVRRRELERAAKVLGIDSVHIHDDERHLPDSMTKRWNIDEVTKIIKEYLGKHKTIGTVITFDAFGISGHPNHCDTSIAARKALSETPKAYDLLELVTVPLAVKYTGLTGIIYEAVNLMAESAMTKFDRLAAGNIPAESLPASYGPDQYVALIDLSDAWKFGFGAMKCHGSQLVWFRYLYLIFSRYLHVNVLVHRKPITDEGR
jgi:N-acetylglucosaminylphosphatidylinositol deacetylase